jgi:hypothetical protein
VCRETVGGWTLKRGLLWCYMEEEEKAKRAGDGGKQINSGWLCVCLCLFPSLFFHSERFPPLFCQAEVRREAHRTENRRAPGLFLLFSFQPLPSPLPPLPSKYCLFKLRKSAHKIPAWPSY